MRLTLGCGYALRALEYLAAQPGGRPATAHDIAEAQGAPNRFLLRALKALVSAGLLRGPAAATALAGPPAGSRCWRWWRRWTARSGGEAPLALEGRHGLDSRLGAVCQAVADRVRRALGKVRLSDLVGKTYARNEAALSRGRRGAR